MARSSTQAPKGRKPFKLRSEWKIFAWCFLTGIVLWLLISLNEMYNSRIQVNVHYTNFPDEEVFVEPLPQDFTIAVNAKGWDLVGYLIDGHGENIYIDLEEYRRQSYILTRWLRVPLQQQMSQNISINDIYPDTISLRTEPKAVKKVPVKLNHKFSFEKQFALGERITFSPDSVTVEGPESLVRSMNAVNTEVLTLKGLNKIVETEVQLQKPPKHNISYSTNTIKVRVPAYQLTEQVTELPVEIINPKVKGNIRLIPSNVKVTYLTTLNKYEDSDSRLFEAVVDGSQIDTARNLPLRVQIISKPDFTYQLRVKPEYVDYLIIR